MTSPRTARRQGSTARCEEPLRSMAMPMEEENAGPREADDPAEATSPRKNLFLPDARESVVPNTLISFVRELGEGIQTDTMELAESVKQLFYQVSFGFTVDRDAETEASPVTWDHGAPVLTGAQQTRRQATTEAALQMRMPSRWHARGGVKSPVPARGRARRLPCTPPRLSEKAPAEAASSGARQRARKGMVQVGSVLDLSNLLRPAGGKRASVTHFPCQDGSIVLVGTSRLLQVYRLETLAPKRPGTDAPRDRGRVGWQLGLADVRQCLVLQALEQDMWFLNVDARDSKASRTFSMAVADCSACAQAIEKRLGGVRRRAREMCAQDCAEVGVTSTLRIGDREVKLSPGKSRKGRRALVPAVASGPPRMRCLSSATVGTVTAGANKENVVGPPEALERFLRMRQLGVPMGAVEQKMRAEGLDEAAVARLRREDNVTGKAQPAPPPASEASGSSRAADVPAGLQKFMRMRQLGVPPGAVEQKMRADGLDDATLALFWKLDASGGRTQAAPEAETKAATQSSAPVPAALQKFVRMRKLGVPLGAVAQKMRADGLGDEAMAQLEAHVAGKRPTFKAASTAVPIPSVRPEGEISCPAPLNPSLAKFAKMLAVGVPVPAVARKMRDEGHGPSEVDAVCQRTASAAGPPKASSDGGAPSRPRRSEVPLQKLHWKPVPQERLEKSIWASPGKAAEPGALEAQDIAAIASIFGMTRADAKSTAAGAPGDGPGDAGKKKAGPQHLIDMRKANNVGVGLAQFRRFPSYESLCVAVVRQDRTNLTRDHLATLQSMLPTPTEARVVAAFTGDPQGLGRAEQFFLAVANVPLFAEKLDCFATSLGFDEACAVAERDLGDLRRACEEVRRSATLARLLQRLLAVGNLLNEGTYRGDAAGITLDSLMRVTTTKGSDRKTTVLDFVVEDAVEKGDTALLGFRREIEGLPAAARLSLGETLAEVSRLRTRAARVEAAVAAAGRRGDSGAADLAFLTKSSGFCRLAGGRLEELEALATKVREAAVTLLEYFAEEPQPENVGAALSTLLQFASSFDAAVTKAQRKVKARQKKARA